MTTDSDRWARIEELCQAALDHDTDQQAALLNSACGADQDLRRVVESLLAHRRRAESFIEAPAMEVAARAVAAEQAGNDFGDSRLIGRLISQYRIVEKVASGGMGDVYRAVRADGSYDKQVAVKIIQGARSTDFFLARFQNERQILATLDHPNIARLFDGGTTEEGLPYVVMEYVQGLPIDEFCAEKRLDVDELLTLFRTVCSAVQYAHQNLVVHRDLKPTNILVAAEGVPKLLDFGIAKILHPQHGEEALQQTVTLLRLLTPDYASPEQVRNEPISTSSDVYSLGVILYELLTGRGPYRLESHSAQEMMTAICDTEPEKPSTAVMHAPTRDGTPSGDASASTRSKYEKPAKLREILKGDLDNIVLKALRKEPQRRYSSVEQFSEDLRRYLAGLPVLAHQDSFGYRASKFISRHKLGVAAAVMFAIAAFAGLSTILYEAHIARVERARAEARFNDVRTLANSLIFDVDASIRDLAGSTAARKLIVEEARQYLDSLARESKGDLALQRELATAYKKVGDVQGSPRFANIGDTAGAVESYRKALSIWLAVVRDSHASSEDQLALIEAYTSLGDTQRVTGDFSGALGTYRKAYRISEKLVATPQANGPESQEALGAVLFGIADSLQALDDLNGSLEYYKKSAAVRESISGGSPDFQKYVQVRLAGTYGYMSGVFSQQGEIDTAISLQSHSHDILAALIASDPKNATLKQFLLQTDFWIGYYYHKKGVPDKALLNYRLALKGYQELTSADPHDVLAKRYLAMCYSSIGQTLAAQRQEKEGISQIRAAIEILEALVAADPGENYHKLNDLAGAYSALAEIYARAAVERGILSSARIANWTEARSFYQKTLHILLQMKEKRSGHVDPAELDRVAREINKAGEALKLLKAGPG